MDNATSSDDSSSQGTKKRSFQSPEPGQTCSHPTCNELKNPNYLFAALHQAEQALTQQNSELEVEVAQLLHLWKQPIQWRQSARVNDLMNENVAMQLRIGQLLTARGFDLNTLTENRNALTNPPLEQASGQNHAIARSPVHVGTGTSPDQTPSFEFSDLELLDDDLDTALEIIASDTTPSSSTEDTSGGDSSDQQRPFII